MLPIFGSVTVFQDNMTSIQTKGGNVNVVGTVLPREREKAKTLPFRYQFAAGAVAGVSEVSQNEVEEEMVLCPFYVAILC